MIIVGICLAVMAAVTGTLSKQLIAASDHFKRDSLFLLGSLLNMVVGPVIDASAFAFAPQVVVAPLACLDVILNALTAPHTLYWQGERLTRAHVVGVAAVTLGAICTSVFAEAEDKTWTAPELEEQIFRRWQSITFIALGVTFMVTAVVMLALGRVPASVRGLLLGMSAGLCMGFVFFAKGLLSIIRITAETGRLTAWKMGVTYVLLVCAFAGPLLGQFFMRKGLAEYKGVYMVTNFQGAHIIAACMSGFIVMGEMSSAAIWRILLYWGGVAMIIGGLAVMNNAAGDSVINDPASQDHRLHTYAMSHAIQRARTWRSNRQTGALESAAPAVETKEGDRSTNVISV